MSFQPSENQTPHNQRDQPENALNDDASIQDLETLSAIEKLPSEITDQILSYLPAQDIACVFMTCRVLARHAINDRLWRHLVNSHLHMPVQDPGIFPSFRALYYALMSVWFIPQHKIWFGDTQHTGSLIIARYDNRRGVIEGYRVLANRGDRRLEMWPSNPEVIIPSFNPTVHLWLDDAVLGCKGKLGGDSESSSPKAGRIECTWVPEFSMRSSMGWIGLNLCRKEDTSYEKYNGDDWEDSIWPPLNIPCENRCYRAECDQKARAPEYPYQASEHTFTIFRGSIRNPLIPQRFDETTYATLDESLYTPTEEKPYQGIWVGDYSAHGCEFLLFYQCVPEGPAETQSPEQPKDGAERVVPRGSLKAVKLTGDPNVPRGELSFWADDIGPDGLLRVETEEPFKNARIVKSWGQVAGLGYRDGMLSSLLTYLL